jgi:hypothetical protein
MPNRRNSTKPRRIPVIGESIKLNECIYYNSLYLFEIEANTIHVLMNSGYCLSGYCDAYEYIWNGE